MKPLRIAIVGSGGVGGYFGARLAASGADVAFVARGAHLDAMRTRGLRLESPKGDLHLPHVNATDDTSTVGAVDIVLFATVKLYDAESAAAVLPPLLAADTAVVPLQNGVDAVATVARVVGPAHAAGGAAYISAVVSEPGVIHHTSMDRPGLRRDRWRAFASFRADCRRHASPPDFKRASPTTSTSRSGRNS